ncbi:MAG: rhodanese-like domain-containing protein [Candidatus Adiutrix sp.]|nr:rhodanese-like domain-containing protein [Candidatus Adiutrix sp.]
MFFSTLTAAAVNHWRPNPLRWNWAPPVSAFAEINSLEDLDLALASPRTVLVDARDELFYRVAHIPGASSLPLNEAAQKLPFLIDGLPAGAKIIVYCSDPFCRMAEELAAMMAKRGLSPAVFKPGFQMWESEGRPAESAL